MKTENEKRDVARVDEQPLSGSAELPQRPTEELRATAPENAIPGSRDEWIVMADQYQVRAIAAETEIELLRGKLIGLVANWRRIVAAVNAIPQDIYPRPQDFTVIMAKCADELEVALRKAIVKRSERI